MYDTEPDWDRDGIGSRLTGLRRFAADLEVLHREIRLGHAGLAAWWARRAVQDARACGVWMDEPQRKQAAA